MGLSIWAMHFIAMLGFNPGGQARYSVGLTIISLLLAIAATTLAFFFVDDKRPRRLLAAGTFMGLGICAMHYVGMAALSTNGGIRNEPLFVILAAVVAISASTGALLVARRDRTFAQRGLAAVVLGFAIVGMHYTAMLGIELTPITTHEHSSGLDPITLAIGVASGTMLILFLALIAALSDRRFEALAAREAVRSEQQLRAIMEHLPFGIFVAERPSGAILFSNAEAESLLRHSISGAKVWNAHGQYGAIDASGQPLPAEQHALYQAMHSGERVGPRVQAYRRGDGAIVQLEVTAAPVTRDVEGRAFAVVAFQDVTAKLKAEEEARHAAGLRDSEARFRLMNELLEQRVDAALAEKAKAQEELMHAQRLESLGRLTGGVAHDFNNLLTVVIGALDVISRQPENAERQMKLAEAALAAAKRGEGLTKQLLTFARRQPLRTEACDLNQLIREGEPLMQRAAGDRVTLSLDLLHEPAIVEVDPAQFESALLNLVVNAVDATSQGGAIAIETRIRELGDAELSELSRGRYLCVSVSDTGGGMSADVLQHIFEPFFTTKPPGKGTGLGLSQVYGFVRQSGGTVKVHSALGHGTTFEVLLPMLEQVVVAEPVRRSNAARRTLRILLTEDDASVGIITEALLRDLGHEVTRANDASEALGILRSTAQFDVLLSDIAMPGGMHGIELARTVTRSHPELKVLLVSGYAGDSLAELATDDWPFLSKPYSQDDLELALQALFEEPPSVRSA